MSSTSELLFSCLKGLWVEICFELVIQVWFIVSNNLRLVLQISPNSSISAADVKHQTGITIHVTKSKLAITPGKESRLQLKNMFKTAYIFEEEIFLAPKCGQKNWILRKLYAFGAPVPHHVDSTFVLDGQKLKMKEDIARLWIHRLPRKKLLIFSCCHLSQVDRS